ncbi:MFS transporter [Glutamicibacter sp. V16R2B1]|uniref:MFS transporter n=1 Tax=Glutamicibacter sp. V16R2B1 TaxID=2036207 RepID=UPI0010FD7A78|nr:MFS transporter [Glutamicibacter sp. V16R2B1]TLK54846.1 MFS transporter [Glutamicibacter sp. V16R2B1]
MHTGARRPGLGLLAVLLSAVGIAPLLNYGLSATSDLIIRELGISEAQFGLLATVCFGFAAVGNAVFSKFSDRQPDRTLMLLIFGAAAVSMGLAALPGGYLLLLAAAALSGLAQSFPNGVTNRVLAQRVPSARRIAWTGVKQSGVQVSQLVGSVGFPLLAAWIGWHGASLVGAVAAGVLGLAAVRVLAAVPLLAHDAPPRAAEAVPVPRTAGGSTRSMILALTVFGFINGMGVQATNVYLPLFAVRELDFSLVLGGLTAAAAGAIGVTARVGWGRMMSRGISAPRLLLLLAVLALAGAGAFLLAESWHCPALLWLAVALHGASALGVSVVLMAALLRAVPASLMGSASGIVSAGQFGGFTIGPLVMGMVISSAGGFTLGWLMVAGIYLCCTVLGVLLVLRARRRG